MKSTIRTHNRVSIEGQKSQHWRQKWPWLAFPIWRNSCRWQRV